MHLRPSWLNKETSRIIGQDKLRVRYKVDRCWLFGCIEDWDHQGAWCARTMGCHRPKFEFPVWKRVYNKLVRGKIWQNFLRRNQ